jgi:hypothetical protein
MKSDRSLRRLPWRKITIAASALLLLYALCGFFLVPWIARGQIEKHFAGRGLTFRMASLRTNPFALTATIEGVDLKDAAGDDLLSFDRLYVNFQSSSLFRRAWTFREIHLVGPVGNVIREADGSFNVSALVPPPAPEEPAEPAGPAALPRLIVGRFALDAGGARFTDRTRPTPFATQAGPVSFTLTGFSTLPDDAGNMAFEATLESGARFTWSGRITANPIGSTGSVAISRTETELPWRYFQDLVGFRVAEGQADVGFDYEVRYADGRTSLRIRNLIVTFENLALRPLEGEDSDTDILRLAGARLEGGRLEWPERAAGAGSLRVSGLRLALSRNPEGVLNLLEHVAPSSAAGRAGAEAAAGAPEAPAPAPLSDWTLNLSTFALESMEATFEDRVPAEPMVTGIRALNAQVTGLSNAPDALFDFNLALDVTTGGHFAAEGKLGLLPRPVLDAALQLDGLSLVPAKSYLAGVARLRLDAADLSLKGRATSDAREPLRYRGGMELTRLSLHDTRLDERFLGLESGKITDMTLESTGLKARIAALDLKGLYGRLTIYQDGTTNLGEAIAAQANPAAAQAPAPAATPQALPFAVEIGEVRLTEGAADFADLSLPLPFNAHIDPLTAKVSEISSGGTAARVDAEGTVDDHGLAKIEGSLDFFAPDRRADIAVSFRNVDLPRLSPYSGKFAGYKVENGRLSLDLHYLLKDRQLESQNNIIIDEMTLGEKVESPDAVGLPLRLAVAMLKDRNGRIQLDVPVTGSLDAPEFSIGRIVWQAIKSALTKVATAPFVGLARLFGFQGKDLELLEFAAGRSDLAPPAREKLETVTKALTERPELILEVPGVFDETLDGAALRLAKLEAAIAERSAQMPQDPNAPLLIASEKRRAVMETLFLERFPRPELEAIAAAHVAPAAAADGSTPAAPPAQPPAAALDLVGYLDALRDRLAAAMEVGVAELTGLADARSQAVAGFFAAGGAIGPDRIQIKEPVAHKDRSDEWVRLRLELGAK